jgi:glucose uptake protein
MILPQSYGAALFLIVLSMLCWGLWASMYKLAGKWRFELFYLDYAIGVIVICAILALTAGTQGYDGFALTDDILHAGKQQWLFALVSGIVFNLANMLVMAAAAVAGLAVAFPVGIGLALIVAVTLQYASKSTANPVLLFSGCLLVLAAVLMDAYGHNLLGHLRHEQSAKAGKAKSTRRPTSLRGVILAGVGGLLMGSFLPVLERARAGENGLGPYSVALLFAIGVFGSTMVYELFFMNLPVEGEPLEVREIFMSRPMQHLWGFAGGILWGLGGVAFLVVASSTVDLPASLPYLAVPASALIAALLGLFAWKEFAGADSRLKAVMAITLVVFCCGAIAIALSPRLVAGF